MSPLNTPILTGSGTTILSGANTYIGATTVAAGTLQAGAANSLSAASAHSVASGANLALGGFGQSVATLANAGAVTLAADATEAVVEFMETVPEQDRRTVFSTKR